MNGRFSCELSVPESGPLSLFAAVERADVAEGMRAGFAPAHARAFEPLADHRLAGALHDPAAYLPSLRQILRVLHPVQVVAEIAVHLLLLLPQRRRLPRRPLPVL